MTAAAEYAEAAQSGGPSLVGSSKTSTGGFEQGGEHDDGHLVELPPRPFDPFAYELHRGTFAQESATVYSEEKAGRFLQVNAEDWRGLCFDRQGNEYVDPRLVHYRATVVTDTTSQAPPPVNTGDRVTDRLSTRAKKSIEDAAKYMHRRRAGFRTFITLTFDKGARADILADDLKSRDDETRRTIGNRITAFLNVLQQRHRNGLTVGQHYRRAGRVSTRERGYLAKTPEGARLGVVRGAPGAEWTPIELDAGYKLGGDGRPFQFVWVIENPENDDGEANPHVHVLMNWAVKKNQFHAWAAWIERAWGVGFAKLERIRKPAAAAAYMAKAAHYLTKGSEGGQGDVRGNRYGIARDARPPKARTVGIYFASWIREAIHAGREAAWERRRQGRKAHKSLWFSRHAFGAIGRKAWGSLCTALKRDGFEFEEAGQALSVVRLNNFMQREAVDYWRSRHESAEEVNEFWAWARGLGDVVPVFPEPIYMQ